MISGRSLEEYLHVVKAGPGEYHNSRGILNRAGAIVSGLGSKAVISAGKRAYAAIEKRLLPALRESGIAHELNAFQGESSLESVNELMSLCKRFKPDFIIGAGGGKSIDTAKIVADALGKPIVTVPTIAATCSASSPLGILYSAAGVYMQDYYPARNPNIVLVDPEVLIKAPPEYLVSGILDSLSKWYEGGASLEGATNADMFDFMAIKLAEYLNANMLEKAGRAIQAVKTGVISDEFIDVINMNVYLAGTIQAFGVKAVRNGIAHSVHNGLTVLKESHGLVHGIKVGYGIAIQHILLDSGQDDLRRLLDFYNGIEFEPSFRRLGIQFIDRNIQAVAAKTVDDPLMRREPFNTITEGMVVAAIRKLEAQFGA